MLAVRETHVSLWQTRPTPVCGRADAVACPDARGPNPVDAWGCSASLRACAGARARGLRVTCSLLAAQVALSESLVAVRARDRERVDCYRVVFGTRRALPSSTGLSAVRGRRLTSPPGSCFVLVRAHCSRMEHSVPTLSHLLHPISLDGAGSVSARLHGPAPQVGVYGQEIN